MREEREKDIRGWEKDNGNGRGIAYSLEHPDALDSPKAKPIVRRRERRL